MTAPDAQWQVEIAFESAFFLEVPTDARSRDVTELDAWVDDAVSQWNHADQWAGDAAGLRARLAGQISLLSPHAFAAFLFCPRGVPADALVEVFLVDTDASALAEIDASAQVALPQRVRDIVSPSLGEGRVIASVSALEDGAVVGQLRYQFLADGVQVETTVVSSDLGMLGSGLELFDALASGISVARRERTDAA